MSDDMMDDSGSDSRESGNFDSAGGKTGGGPSGLVVLLVLFVFGGLAYLFLFPDIFPQLSEHGAGHPSAGVALTALQLEPLLNADADLTLDDLKGEVALVNYWGPWCPPCRMEMPHLVELEREFQDREDFRFVSVSCSGGSYNSLDQLRDETEKFTSKQDITFPIYHDESAASRTALVRDADMGTGFGFPTTVVLDRENRIVGIWEGYTPDVPRQIRETILETLGEPGA